MPRVSVIMGIYNSNNEEMVKSAIDSILNQTFKDFEFIICDDGSTDGTYELVKRLTKHDDRVILIQNEKNSGLAYSLNHCLSIAKGEYIARMDADDISLPERLEEEVAFLDNNKEFAIVGCNVKFFNSNGIWGKRCLPEFPEKASFLFTSPFVHPSILIRAEVMTVLCGYRVEKETLRAEDYDLFMRMYSKGYKGYNLQAELYCFREDENAYKRRAYKYRLDEAKVRYKGFKSLGLMPRAIPYVIKPLIVGLLPQKFLSVLRNKKI